MDEQQLEILCGYSERALESYLGRPFLKYPLLAFYKRGKGIIAVKFIRSEGKIVSSGCILYGTKGKIMHTKNLTPIKFDLKNIFLPFPLSGFIEKFGLPHAEIGSGFTSLIYLSGHESIYILELDREEILRIREKYIHL